MRYIFRTAVFLSFHISFNFGRSCKSTRPTGCPCRLTTKIEGLVELGAHGLETGQFQIEDFPRSDQVAHAAELAKGGGRLAMPKRQRRQQHCGDAAVMLTQDCLE